MHLSRLTLSVALTGAVALGCGGATTGPGHGAPHLSPDQHVVVDAVVHHTSLDAGCWTLQTSNATYQPSNLPAAFQVDGELVRAGLHGAEGVLSACTGDIVTLDSIRAR